MAMMAAERKGRILCISVRWKRRDGRRGGATAQGKDSRAQLPRVAGPRAGLGKSRHRRLNKQSLDGVAGGTGGALAAPQRLTAWFSPDAGQPAPRTHGEATTCAQKATRARGGGEQSPDHGAGATEDICSSHAAEQPGRGAAGGL